MSARLDLLGHRRGREPLGVQPGGMQRSADGREQGEARGVVRVRAREVRAPERRGGERLHEVRHGRRVEAPRVDALLEDASGPVRGHPVDKTRVLSTIAHKCDEN